MPELFRLCGGLRFLSVVIERIDVFVNAHIEVLARRDAVKKLLRVLDGSLAADAVRVIFCQRGEILRLCRRLRKIEHRLVKRLIVLGHIDILILARKHDHREFQAAFLCRHGIADKRDALLIFRRQNGKNLPADGKPAEHIVTLGAVFLRKHQIQRFLVAQCRKQFHKKLQDDAAVQRIRRGLQLCRTQMLLVFKFLFCRKFQLSEMHSRGELPRQLLRRTGQIAAAPGIVLVYIAPDAAVLAFGKVIACHHIPCSAVQGLHDIRDAVFIRIDHML